MIATTKSNQSLFSKNLGLLKDYLQENQKIKGLIDMADQLGSNRNSLRWYISGEQEPSVSFLKKLSEQYNVSLNWLVEGRGPMIRDEIFNDIECSFHNLSLRDRSNFMAKLDFFEEEEQEFEKLLGTLATQDLPEEKRLMLESRCTGQLFNMQKRREKLFASGYVEAQKGYRFDPKALKAGTALENKKHIKDISMRIRKFTRGKSVEFQAVIDEIVGNL